MDLLQTFVEKNVDFSCYDEFYENFKLRIPKVFNFATDVVDFYAKNDPAKVALVWCNDEGVEKTFTFAQLADESIKAAAFFYSLGVKAGDVVMLSLHRHFYYWIFIIALHRLGAIALPVPSQLLKADLEYRIKQAKPKVIVAAPHNDSVNQVELAALGKVPLVAAGFTKSGWIDYSAFEYDKSPDKQPPLPDISVQSPMLIYFTSGTQGYPKMVVHNYLYPLSHIITAKYWQCVVPDGLHLSVAETGWAKASWGKIYGQWIAGSAVFVYDRQTFNPERILEKIAKYKITTFCANPTVYRYLLNLDFSAYDLSSLTHCCSAGEALDQNLFTQFYQKTGLKIYEGYGQTETSVLTANFCFNKQDRDIEKTSMGKPSPLYDLDIDSQSGEVVMNLKGGHPIGLFTGYFNEPALTEQAFEQELYHTGDIAERGPDGCFYFKGRKDDIIKSSGFRISPYEVESVLSCHPAVFECAAVGQKDISRGQIVAAVVVPAPGYEPSKNLEHELISYMHKNTALYKCPRKIEFVKELPKTYNGKIIRRKSKDEKSEE